MFIKYFSLPFVGGEKGKKIFDASTFQGASKVIHGLIDEVGTEDKSDHTDRDIYNVSY